MQLLLRIAYASCMFISCLPLFLHAQNPVTFYEPDETEMQKRLEGSTRHYVGFSIGAAFPEGSYRSDLGAAATAYARPGFSANVEGAFHITKYLGAKALAGYYANNINKGDYSDKLNSYLPSPTQLWFQNNTKWRNAYALAGPQVSLPEKKVLFELYMAFGLAYVSAPEVKANGSYNESPLNYSRNADKDLCPAFALGASISYRLPGSFNHKIFAKAEYIGANPKLHIYEHLSSNSFALNMSKTARQHTGIFQIAAGIRQEFGKHFQ